MLRPALAARLAGGCVFVSAFLACGGGGGGSAATAVAPSPTPAPATPQVTAVSPTTVTPPVHVTATGSNLDQVQSARLGNTTLAIAAQSTTTLALDVPVGAASGFLTLVGRDGVSRHTPS
ncbi:MAG: hypothetical protein NZL99_07425 [Burkholderiaceae bacterium]|nr:hypothetical protein [Burkholderiaceae bacterium]